MKNKSRIIILLMLLISETDESHWLKTNELIEMLSKKGFSVNRKTIADDIQTLINTGFDIVCKRKKENSYYLSEVLFDYVELKIIIDAITYCNNLSLEIKENMVSKLLSLVSKNYSKLNLVNRADTYSNKSIYVINEMLSGMNELKAVTFQMYKYVTPCKRELKDNGYIYKLYPYNFIWNDNKYYVVGYSHKHNALCNFRIDRLCNVKIIDETFIRPFDLDVDKISNTKFHMFPGEYKAVRLFCESSALDSFVDKFGEVQKFDKFKNGFIINVEVDASPTFYGWILQFGGKIKVLGPKSVKFELEEMITNYK